MGRRSEVLLLGAGSELWRLFILREMGESVEMGSTLRVGGIRFGRYVVLPQAPVATSRTVTQNPALSNAFWIDLIEEALTATRPAFALLQ